MTRQIQKAIQLLKRLNVDSALGIVHFDKPTGGTIIGSRAVLEFKAEMKKVLTEEI